MHYQRNGEQESMQATCSTSLTTAELPTDVDTAHGEDTSTAAHGRRGDRTDEGTSAAPSRAETHAAVVDNVGEDAATVPQHSDNCTLFSSARFDAWHGP